MENELIPDSTKILLERIKQLQRENNDLKIKNQEKINKIKNLKTELVQLNVVLKILEN